MIDVLEIKKAIIDNKILFYVGWDKVYCQSNNGDTIQVLDLSEHDKQIRAEVIEELLSKCNSFPNNSDCVECSFAKWKDNEWDGCVIEQLKENK